MRTPWLVALLASVPAAVAQEQVELLRDRWGVPHVFAASDQGAMYGLGWATAEDRPFQMHYSLRVIQGRLCEVIGNARHRNGRTDAVQTDRKMRTFGFWRHAERLAAELDPESVALLQAYSQGVNDWFAAHRDDLPEPFAATGLDPEPWTPAACLASWWHLGQFFGTDGTRDLLAGRNRDDPRRQVPEVPPDDDVAVVQRGDVSDEWVARVDAFYREHVAKRTGQETGEGRKLSHAWVVGGGKTTTGAAVLCSDPQTPVANPSLLYEFHVRGASFDARGVGVAGSPIILIGFNKSVAWGMTALGADQADLFRLHTDPAHPRQYRLDGEWHEMTRWLETIEVRGGRPVQLVVHETVFGPVVSEFAFRGEGDPEVALRRVPVNDRGVETIQGALAMMRATDAEELAAALAGWRFPSANCVFGDARGAIGYAAIGAIPIRSRHSDSSGGTAHRGDERRFDWQGFVPAELMPQVIDPASGYLLSANHRPIAAFYPIPFGEATGGQGDTIRSWRLRELLHGKERFTPEEVLAIHGDMVDPALREIVRIGFHLRDRLRVDLQPDAERALEHLEEWFARGAPSDLRVPGTALATLMDTMFRRMGTPLAERHGGGQSGLARFLKSTQARIAADPRAPISAEEREWVERLLAQAWQQAQRRYGSDPSSWNETARFQLSQQPLGWFQSLDGFPSLNHDHDLLLPALFCVDGNTIQSQRAQAYSQWVPLHDVDQARSICPPGQSERLDSDRRLCCYELWQVGNLHPAPLSRPAVEELAASTVALTYDRRE